MLSEGCPVSPSWFNLESFCQNLPVAFGVLAPIFITICVLLFIGWLFLKGFALWFAARNYHKGWFIAMFIINTAGILEAIYLIFFRKQRETVPPSA